jgi:hypothetical protein
VRTASAAGANVTAAMTKLGCAPPARSSGRGNGVASGYATFLSCVEPSGGSDCVLFFLGGY